MGQQIVHRLLISFPALLGVLFLCFCLLQVVPADPAMIIAGPDAKAETIASAPWHVAHYMIVKLTTREKLEVEQSQED